MAKELGDRTGRDSGVEGKVLSSELGIRDYGEEGWKRGEERREVEAQDSTL